MANIELDSITNANSTGVFDKLMEAVNSQIESQYLNNRITGSDYANVYLGGMQAVLQQSMQYVLQEQLTEVQIDGVIADNALKAKQELLVDEQIKGAYAERVGKDKLAAKQGLDNVMKQSETSRAADDQFVYTPRYEDTP